MQNPDNISFIIAFFAGTLTFFSPCIMPLIPSYISYLTGISFRELAGENKEENRRKIRAVTALHSLSFIIGFSVVFILLGATATFLGKTLFQYQAVIRKAGGLFIIFFGLVIMGIIKLPFLQKEKKIAYGKKGVSVLGSMLVGVTFAIAWTPCVGPVLGSILIYASATASVKVGIKLLVAFSLGLGLPFFLSGLIINSFLTYIKRIEKYMQKIEIAAGVILILFGVLLLKGG